RKTSCARDAPPSAKLGRPSDIHRTIFRSASMRLAHPIASSFSSQRISKMTLPFASAVHETIRKEFPTIDAKAVTRALVANGHAQNDMQNLYASRGLTPISPLQAAAANPRGLQEVIGMARHLGFHINAADTKPLDTLAMEAAFKGKDVAARASVKTALFQLGMIAG